MRNVILSLILSISLPAFSTEWKEIDGIYAITAKDMVSEVEDSHFKVQLKGEAANDLFLSMKVKIKTDECTGALSKNIEYMQCLHYVEENKYECHFSINIADQVIEQGISC